MPSFYHYCMHLSSAGQRHEVLFVLAGWPAGCWKFSRIIPRIAWIFLFRLLSFKFSCIFLLFVYMVWRNRWVESIHTVSVMQLSCRGCGPKRAAVVGGAWYAVHWSRPRVSKVKTSL